MREVWGSNPGSVKSAQSRHRCNVSSELCSPGAKPRRWIPLLVARVGLNLNPLTSCWWIWISFFQRQWIWIFWLNIRRTFEFFDLNQGCPTRGPRKGFEWPARVFQNDQSYQLNCYVIHGELAFREIGINFVDCFLSNWFYFTTMQIVLHHISHIVTSVLFPHNRARALRTSSQW